MNETSKYLSNSLDFIFIWFQPQLKKNTELFLFFLFQLVHNLLPLTNIHLIFNGEVWLSSTVCLFQSTKLLSETYDSNLYKNRFLFAASCNFNHLWNINPPWSSWDCSTSSYSLRSFEIIQFETIQLDFSSKVYSLNWIYKNIRVYNFLC